MLTLAFLSLGYQDLFGVEVVQMPDLNGDGVHEFALTDNCPDWWPDCDPSLWIFSGRDVSLVSRIAVLDGARNPRSMVTLEGTRVLTQWGAKHRTYGVDVSSPRVLDVARRRGSPLIVIPDISNDGFDDLVAVRDLAVGREVVALSGLDLALLWRQPLSGMPEHYFMLLMPRREGDAFANVIVAYAARLDGPPEVLIHALSSNRGEVLVTGTVAIEGAFVSWESQLLPLGDLDGDGYSDVLLKLNSMSSDDEWSFIVVSAFASEILFRIEAPSILGPVASVGDLSGDGQRDLVFGAWNSVEVRSGTDGRVLYTVAPEDGDWSGAWFGSGIVDLGDVNGDHATDFVVAASPPHYAAPQHDGWFVVVSGCDGTILSRHQRKDYVTDDR